MSASILSCKKPVLCLILIISEEWDKLFRNNTCSVKSNIPCDLGNAWKLFYHLLMIAVTFQKEIGLVVALHMHTETILGRIP